VKPLKDISWLIPPSTPMPGATDVRAGGKYSSRQMGRSLECCHPQTSCCGLRIIILYYCCDMFVSSGQIL